MGRTKGSLNKKLDIVQLEFDTQKEFEEKTEVCMAASQTDELEVIQQEIDQARIELENTKRQIEAKKQELKSSEISILPVKDVPSVSTGSEANKKKIAEMKARDSVMVTGKFYNLRVKGQSVKLPYQKYGDEPVKWHNFEHGQVYTIMKGFADQINGGTETDPCYYTPHFIKNEGIILNPDDPESGINAVDTTDKKFSFVPLNF